MVTYADLFQFVIMLCAIITLVVTTTRKKQHPLPDKRGATFCVETAFCRRLAVSQRSALLLYILYKFRGHKSLLQARRRRIIARRRRIIARRRRIIARDGASQRETAYHKMRRRYLLVTNLLFSDLRTHLSAVSERNFCCQSNINIHFHEICQFTLLRFFEPTSKAFHF